MARTVVVVPCFDEAERLQDPAFLEFVREQPGVDLLMVDDGSRDATLERLRGLEKQANGRISTLALEHNRGKAEAVRQGVLTALVDEPTYVGYWDADLATPLDAIPEFVELLERRPEIGMVLGARVNLMGREITRNPARHYLGRVFATAASLTLGLEVYDTQCGAKLLRVDGDTLALFSEPFVASWVFDVELLARVRALAPDGRAAERLYELPLRVWRDVPGSKVRARDFLRAFLELRRIARRYRPLPRPGARG